MLEDLQFVKGAVGKKEIVTGLTHFKIEKGTVRSYNGTLSLCSPIALDFDCTPKADLMVKAIEGCKDTTQITLTDSGRLSVRSQGFSAYVPCLQEPTPHVEPEGETVEIDSEAFIKAFKVIYPFVGTDAYRPFCTGVRISGQCASATNNIIFVEYWVGANFPKEVLIPRTAIQELLRIKELPTHIQYSDKSLTFHYGSGRWLNTSLINTQFPNTEPLFSRAHNAKEMDTSLFDAIEAIMPFADDMKSCFIENGTVRTHLSTAEGASHTIQDFSIYGRYQMDMLMLLKNVAKTIDLTCYTADQLAPSVFYGDRLRGIISGLRL